ncbi:restriction endonuclease subunit S [Sphingobacterium siyangense]|uniref:restriction endonuclease subunit S n=1 Tax=Sphingobacterium siyangense TaxID=459529 RepID=UPI003C7659E2
MTTKKLKVGNVPNLRFPEFTEEWETKKLGDLCKMQSGKFVSASEIFERQIDGLYPCYGGNGLRGYTKSFNQDGIYSLIGRQGALCGNVNLVNGKFHATEHAVVATPNDNIDTIWMFYLLTNLNLNQYSTGMAQPGLSVQNLEKINTVFPKAKIEQQKIATFLSLIDRRIITQNKIIENLKTQMLGLQEKIFRQMIKLKDHSGKILPLWSFKKGGELFESISNKNHNSDLPILAITQDLGAIPRDLIDYQITVTERSVESYKVVEIGNFIISLRSFQGGIEHSDYKGICSPAYIILRNKIEITQHFYKYYFKTPDYIRLLNRKLEGIRDGKMISYSYFAEIELPFPIIEEQQKIASFLSKVDQKIHTEKAILERLENQKKYLLKQMFV